MNSFTLIEIALFLLSSVIISAIGQNDNFISEVSADSFKKLNQITSDEKLLAAVTYGEDVTQKLKRLETAISKSRVKVTKGSISYAQLIDGYPTDSTKHQDLIAKTILKSSSYFLNNFCKSLKIPSHDVGLYLMSIELPSSELKQRCLDILKNKKYEDSYRRLLSADYNDGIYKFRTSVLGSELPTPRHVSSKFYASHSSPDTKDARKSISLVQWSQFIEHDLAKTTVQSMHNGAEIECCNHDCTSVAPRYEHPSCKPLKIAANDTYYKSLDVTCLNYVRSAISIGRECRFGPANQLNQATNHLDLSQIYGSTNDVSKTLRTYRNGRLQSQMADRMEFLLPHSNDFCAHNATSNDSVCYSSGDSRVNINPYVTLLHTIFLRSHNKIAKKLIVLNPHWTDEKLFVTSKRINVGIYQKIIYENWMKVVLGNDTKPRSVTSKPNDNRVSNEFATAGIRFYNTMMPGHLNFDGNSLHLRDLYYKPKDLSKKEYFALLMDAVLNQNAMALDTSYVDDLSTLLFKSKSFGTDALALDIQRGRDHGLNGYVKYYELCTGQIIDKWEDLRGIINPKDLDNLKKVYASVDDIDLIVGAISEIPKSDATVGSTLSCIIGDQLINSLIGDPNVYYKMDPISIKVQKTIDNYSAARLICDTTNLNSVQENVFFVPSPENPLNNCLEMPKLNLKVWQEIV